MTQKLQRTLPFFFFFFFFFFPPFGASVYSSKLPKFVITIVIGRNLHGPTLRVYTKKETP